MICTIFRWPNASVIVYHTRGQGLSPNLLPPQSSSRLNAFFCMESPYHTADPSAVADYDSLPHDFFNITITYRADSDIPLYYNFFRPITPATNRDEFYSEEQV